MQVVLGHNATMLLRVLPDAETIWLVRAVAALADGNPVDPAVPPMLAAAWPAVEAEQRDLMDRWRKRKQDAIRASRTRWGDGCDRNATAMRGQCDRIPTASVDNSGKKVAETAKLSTPPPDSPLHPSLTPAPYAPTTVSDSVLGSDEPRTSSKTESPLVGRQSRVSASPTHTHANTREAASPDAQNGEASAQNDASPKGAPTAPAKPAAKQPLGPTPKNAKRIEAFRKAREKNPYWHPTAIGSDMGAVATDYSDWYDPDRDPVPMAGRLVNELSGPWGKWRSVLGDAKFRDVCATLWGEMNAGDYIENPAAALVLKCKDAMNAPKPAPKP